MCFICRGLWKAVWWVVLGVHVDVHEDWVTLWVAAMYNVLAILSMADTVCLACMQKLCMESMSSACWVCMVCMVYGALLKLCCEIFITTEHCRYGSMEDRGVSNAEHLVHLVRMNRICACRRVLCAYLAT